MNAGRRCNALLFAALLFAAPALAAEGGAARKPSDLKKEPYRDARTVGVLATGDKVEILNKQGGWYYVRSAKGSGWIRMLSVRRSEARRLAVEAAALRGLATGRAGTGQVVSTTGIRGLSEADLKAATYNGAELRKLESFGATPEQAQDFAAQGALKPRQVN